MKITAWINCKLLGYCPECNSTAPEIFMCPLCGYDTKYPFNMKKRNLYWDKYKKGHEKKI